MLKKNILLSLIAATTLFAAEYKDVEVYANNIVQSKDIVKINDGVVVVYDGDILSAKSGIYYAKKKYLELTKDVTVILKSGKKIKAKELKVKLDNKHLYFRDAFLIDKNNLWFLAKSAKKEDNNITFTNTLFSSCCIDNPDWSIKFDKAVYDTKDKTLKVYNAIAYIKTLPVFYLPYFYFPLNKERKSGLLMPTVDYSNSDGFIYSQPIYFAISKSKDLEFNPQIRTKRGWGGYLTYRFANDVDSYGELRAGYFKDKSSYTKKYNLKYSKHYGVEAKYLDETFIDYLSKKGYENKVYLNAVYMNDSDYINVQVNDTFKHHKLGSFYESRLNYYIKNSYFFAGIGFNYYKDTTKQSNSDTLQIAPKLHFNIPYTNIIYNNLSFYLDATLINYTRKRGTKALKAKVKMPLELHFSLFNDYLNLNISEELEATGYDFYNVPINQKKYTSFVLNHKVELSSDLTKIYKSGIHNALFSLTYTKSSILDETWMKYSEIPQNLKVDFVDNIPFESKVTLRTHQYWHSFSNNLDINYILEAYYYPQESKLRDLEQELELKYKNWYFYSKIAYSFVHKQATDIYNKFGYQTSKYGLLFSALWKKDLLSFETLTKEIALSGYYNYSDNLKFKGSIAYNLKDKNLKSWEIGTYLNRKCWSIDFSFGQENRPVIKANGLRGSIDNKFVKVQLKVLPFGE